MVTILTPQKRVVITNDSVKTGIKLGLKEVFKPNITYRLGMLWLILDPFILSAIYAFLIVILRGNSQGFSIVIGVLTLNAMNKAITHSMNSLNNEPFPMRNTSTRTILISLFTQYIAQASIIGFSGALLIFIATDSPFTILLLAPLVCSFLSICGASIGLIIAPIKIKINDVTKIISYLITMSFFIQPVIYSYSETYGIHRDFISWLPHTLGSESIRSLFYGSTYPFDNLHLIQVSSLWFSILIIGLLRFDKSRWEATTW